MLNFLLDLFSTKHGIKELARRLDVQPEQLRQVEVSYRQFTVRKKSGKNRQLSAPNEELKSMQRRILRRLFAKLKTHPKATGFRAGVSFVDNARMHEGCDIVIRLDLVDFFPSISEQQIFKYFRAIGWNRQASRLLTKLTTYEGTLPQGAPTSPMISNLVNYKLDASLSSLAKSYSAVYTRYADDITISLDDGWDVHSLISTCLAIIRRHGYRPHLKKKFDVRRQHQRQVVMGLVVNERAKLPREKRRWLRAVAHRHKLRKQGGYFGPPPSLDSEQLEGWYALQKQIESS